MARDSRFIPRQLRARPLACFSVAFLAGLIVARQRVVPLAAWAACTGLLLAVFVVLASQRKRCAGAVLMLLAVALGGCRMELAEHAIPALETRYSVEISGRIVSEPFTNPDTGRVISKFHIDSINEEPAGVLVRLYLRGDPEPLSAIDYGQRLALTGHIWKPDPVTNPWEFDFGDYLRRNGMAAYATAKIEDVAILDTARDIRSAVIGARRAISARIDALFPRSAAMVRALVLGDRSLLGEEMREAFSRTGTAHLISISGLHVTALSSMLALLLGLFMPKRRANALALLFLIPYGMLVGFKAPFVRATLMFALFTLAPVAGYLSDPITRLCTAMLFYLLARPMDVADAGFALSFSASAGILLLMPPLSRLLGLEALQKRKLPFRRFKRLLRRALLFLPTLLCASLAAQLATLPAVIAWFGVQPLLALPFNLVCVPLCMLGYLGALIALPISAIWPGFAVLLARAPELLFAWLTDFTRWSAALPNSGVRIGRYPAALALLHAGIVLASSELSRLSAKIRRFLPLTLVLVAGLSSLVTFALNWNLSIAFLDAGQADCAVLNTHGHTFVFDAGDTYTPVADYLGATSLHLDGVVLSHPHQDHAGGLIDILTVFRPDVIYVPAGWFEQEDISPAVIEGIETAEALGVPIIQLSAGDTVRLCDSARMTVYSPDANAPPDSVNDLSLLALVECEGQRVLFTGDLSSAGEPEMIPDADVLKVAHHGSDKGSSERFLSAVTPQIAVVSVGENNYGHPGDETLERLANSGADVYLTRDCGAVLLKYLCGEWRVKTYLEASHELE